MAILLVGKADLQSILTDDNMKIINIVAAILISILIFYTTNATSLENVNELTPGTPDDATEFAIAVCLGGLHDLDKIKFLAKHYEWPQLSKEDIYSFTAKHDLDVDGWIAVHNNHPYFLMVNVGNGAFRNNKFVENSKSNICTIIAPNSSHNEITDSLKRELQLKQVYKDPGKTFPISRMNAFRINNNFNNDEVYIMLYSHKDLKPPTTIVFMLEASKAK